MEHPLLEFCATPRQRDIITLCYIEGHSQYQAAKILDCTRNAIMCAIRDIKAKAQRRGYSPDHDWRNPVPDGHKIKGVSTFYDEDGVPIRQWVKSQTDEQRQFEI